MNKNFEKWIIDTYGFKPPDKCPAFTIIDMEAAWKKASKTKPMEHKGADKLT